MIDDRGTIIPDEEVAKFIEHVHHYERELQSISGEEDKLRHPVAIRRFLHSYYHMFPTHEHWIENSLWPTRTGFIEETVMSMCASLLAFRGGFNVYPNDKVFGDVNSAVLHRAAIANRNVSYDLYSLERVNG